MLQEGFLVSRKTVFTSILNPMGLTKEEANLRLEKISTPEQLKELINQLDVTGTGKITVLWSGTAAFADKELKERITSQRIATGLQKANPDFRIFGSTEAYRFLELDKSSEFYNPKFGEKLEEVFAGNRDKIKEFLYGKFDEKTGRRVGTGTWDIVSDNFAKEAYGDIRLVVGGAGMDRIFAQTEMVTLMANPAVKTIEGVPIEALKELEKVGGTGLVTRMLIGISEGTCGMIKIEVDDVGRPLIGADRSYRLDVSDYMKMTTAYTTVPRGMKSLIEFIPEARRLRHVQAVETILELVPALRNQNIVLPVDPDIFKQGQAVGRLATVAGSIGDLVSFGTMLHDANAQMLVGDHRGAHDTVTSWVLETAGGFAAGRVATLLVGPLMATGPVGLLLGAGIIIGSSILGGELAKKLLRKQKKNLRKTFPIIQYMGSPLILDLDDDGVQTIAMNNAYIHFDQDNNGFAERIGWVHANDGLLILDLNGNGSVDGGAELFGNRTRLRDGRYADNGFTALAMYDENKDNRIDQLDPIWNHLRVWRDANSNAQTEAGEWLTLSECKVKSLFLGYVTNKIVDANGNTHAQHGFYEKRDGKIALLTDVWFAKDTINSLPPTPREGDPQINALPDFPGMGIVPSLHQAMLDPGNPGLKDTLLNWMQATRQERMSLTQELVFQWCRADENPFTFPDRDYLYLCWDPLIEKKVAVFEKLAGEQLGYPDVIGDARSLAIMSFNKELVFYFEMVLNTHLILKPLLDLAFPVESELHGALQMDVSDSVNLLRSQFQRDPDPAFIPMLQWLLGQHEGTGLAFFQALQTVASDTKDALNTAMRLQNPDTPSWEWIRGSSEEDEIKGSSGNDFIEAGLGQDTLWGLDGNDSLQGGPGFDSYYGGMGGDTYYITQNLSGERDLIYDEGSAPDGAPDRLVFWDLASHEVRPSVYLNTLRVYDKQNNLIAGIENQFISKHRIEEFCFADGVVWNHDDLIRKISGKGTAGNDLLFGIRDISNHLQGLEGDDTLIGGSLNDHLEGQQGNDILEGMAGRDTLFGGQGDDLLLGGEGGDTYHFGSKANHDRIWDVDYIGNEPDKVIFNNLSTTALTRVLCNGNDLVLKFGSTNTLTLVGQLLPNSRIESFAFVNGPVWSHATLLGRVR